MEISPIEPAGLAKEKNFSLGPARDLPAVHLGQEGQKFRDSAFLNTNDGFGIEVSQASYGGTFIKAASTEPEKFDIEALTNKDGKSSWVKPEHPEDEVMVYGDWGNFVKLVNTDINIVDILKKVGNPGIKYGLIKITNKETNAEKLYAVGAHFDGSADNWKVRVAYFEVILSEKNKELQGDPTPKLT